MSGNKRISGLAVPITASIDPKSYDAISQLNRLFGGIQEDQIKNLAARNPQIAALLKAPYEQFMLDATKAIKAVDTALGKGATPSDASFMKLVGYNNLLKEMGEHALALKASTSISIASNLGLGEATLEANRLNTELRELKSLLSLGSTPKSYAASNLLPSLEAQIAIESQRRYISEKNANAAAVDSRNASPYTHSQFDGPNRGLSPAARAMYDAENRARMAGRVDDPYAHVAAVGLSPAAQADRERQRQQVYGGDHNQNLFGIGPVGLSPAARADREREARRLQVHSEEDPSGFIGPRSVGHTQRQALLMLHSAEQASNADPASWGMQGRNFAARDTTSYLGLTTATRAGGLSRQASHATRFAAQNVGFGIDDAIQSYHYGGVGGSIRAASNNATAIAGMLISSPVIAASTVVGLSVASAILPIILSRFNLGQNTRQMGRFERESFAGRDPSGFAHKEFEDWQVDREKLRFKTKDSLYDMQTKNQYDSVTSDSFGSGIAGQHMELSGAWQQVRSGREQMRSLQEDKASYIADTMKRTHGQGTFYGKFTGDQGDSFTVAIDKQLDELEKAEMSLISNITIRGASLNEVENRLSLSRTMNVARTNNRFSLDQRLRRGGVSYGSYMSSINDEMNQEIAAISSSTMSNDAKDAARIEIRRRFQDQQSNPVAVNRMLNENTYRANQERNTFDYSKSGNSGRVADLQRQQQLETDERTRAVENGDMLFPEAQRRAMLSFKHFNQNVRRAAEDDVTDINPERNPYKNQERYLERQMQDIGLRDLSKTEKENQTRAMLIAAERRRDDLIPQARSFISRSTVGSQEDEELRARMTGNYGPQLRRDDHKGQSTEKMESLLQQLVDELKIKGETIGD